jgi:hypothetical protein
MLGVTAATARTQQFEDDLISIFIMGANLPEGSVTITSVTYNSVRRHLLADSVTVVYVTKTNTNVDATKKLIADGISSGGITEQLQARGYTSASATATPQSVDMTPTPTKV